MTSEAVDLCCRGAPARAKPLPGSHPSLHDIDFDFMKYRSASQPEHDLCKLTQPFCQVACSLPWLNIASFLLPCSLHPCDAGLFGYRAELQQGWAPAPLQAHFHHHPIAYLNSSPLLALAVVRHHGAATLNRCDCCFVQLVHASHARIYLFQIEAACVVFQIIL